MKKPIFIFAFVVALATCNSSGSVPEKTGTGEPCVVKAKATPSDAWQDYQAWTVDRLKDYSKTSAPGTDRFGGWTGETYESTGKFRVENKRGRWYIITPEGHPMISAQVGAFVVGGSERQKNALVTNFGTSQRWAASELKFLKSHGFTGVAGSTNLVLDVPDKISYNVFINPMTAYVRTLRQTYKIPDRMPVVFDEGYAEELETQVSWLAKYGADPFCLGITTDDELFWTDDMLKNYLSVFPADNSNRQTAQAWLDARKGRSGCTIADATAEDIQAFKVLCLDTYLEKTSTAVNNAAPGVMYLGPRFYSWKWELVSEDMMRTAGQYLSIVCINHFTKWEPSQEDLNNWSSWSGRPLMITSFDVKGEDSGLPNTGGLGWVVPTQEDRGIFYENFVIELVKSRCCVGWQWYTYMDNDPEDSTADASNKDSNKGIVAWDFSRYEDLLKHMDTVNGQLYSLTRYFDK